MPPTSKFQADVISFPCAKLNLCEIQIGSKNEYDAHTRSHLKHGSIVSTTTFLHMHIHVHEDLTLQDFHGTFKRTWNDFKSLWASPSRRECKQMWLYTLPPTESQRENTNIKTNEWEWKNGNGMKSAFKEIDIWMNTYVYIYIQICYIYVTYISWFTSSSLWLQRHVHILKDMSLYFVDIYIYI